MTEIRPFIDGAWVDGESTTEITDKYSGKRLGTLHDASVDQVHRATAAAAEAQRQRLHPYERYRILTRAAELLAERSEQFVTTIVADSGFTRSDAQREVERATQTLLLSGEEAKRITGEMVPLDSAPGVDGRLAFTVRHPLGVVAAITPFNSPLNTVAHKVAPALAAGNAVVLKPASYTPMTADLLLRLLLDAGLPEKLMSVVYGGGGSVGQALLEDPVPAFYAFTGSTEVGAHLKATVGLRRSQLELGSLSSTIVCADADVERAAGLCVNAAFRKAGQVCTSIQRLYVDRAIAADFADALATALKGKTFGDPAVPDTFVGPVISTRDADRIESWIAQAAAAGADVVHGGGRDGNVIAPTVLGNVTTQMTIMREEVFGPALCVREYDSLGAAIAEINDTPFGLAAGVFTADIGTALTAAGELRMGSVHINESSSSRVDAMPYGGVKASGMGKEGPHYAIREMTEERLITIGMP